MAVLSWKQRAALVKRYTSFTGTKAVYFLALTQGESSGDTRAYNGAIGTYGLWQIDASSHRDKFTGPDSNLYNPVVNVKTAEKVYKEKGDFSPWAVTPSESDINNSAKALGNDLSRDEIAELLSQIPGFEVPGGAVAGALGIPNPVEPLQQIAGAVTAALGWITDPHNWLRIATFLGGIVLLVLAASSLLANTKVGRMVAGGFAKAKGVPV